jgi:tRNA G18 (ribose-2'-O)-methylase SpoU
MNVWATINAEIVTARHVNSTKKARIMSTRGYFGIGAQGISKPMNLGNLVRSAHAFGASFVFTIGVDQRVLEAPSDTSKAAGHIPRYTWRNLNEMQLPEGCKLVGIELADDATDLPSFRHPLRAAYVLGPERGTLSSDMLALCDHVVKIPTSFCINVATAGAIVMYDRMRSATQFAARPVRAGGPVEGPPRHVHGRPKIRLPQR